MTRTRFTIERDVARYALAVPSQTFEAWNTEEIFQGNVSDDVLAAALASCVRFIERPTREKTEPMLCTLMRMALQQADAWSDVWNDELSWYGPVWGPREVSWAARESFIGFGGFDVRLWENAISEFFPFVVRA